MREDDPIENWLFIREMDVESPQQSSRTFEKPAEDILNNIEQMIAAPNPKRVSFYDTGAGAFIHGRPPHLSPEACDHAQRLYLRIFEQGGNGSQMAQEGLLHAIALAAYPASVPFWVHVLSLSKPRDQFARKRRQLALAALAFLAISNPDTATEMALVNLLDAANPDTRSQAMRYLGRVYRETERALPPEVLARVRRLAGEDPTTGPRFEARLLLMDIKQPLPPDIPNGTYALKVNFQGDKSFYRTIEIRSDDTLYDLHRAIQNALEWDDDHLYSFYLSGQLYDEGSKFVSSFEEEGPLFVDDFPLNELGLTKGHTFIYYFDYGDSHVFEVTVVGINPTPAPGSYPRVIDQKGKRVPQYWNEEEDEEYDGN
jgi:hypothetical protein